MNNAANVVQLIAVLCWLYSSSWYWAQPYHTSKPTGQQWIEEVMCGHPEGIYNELRVHVHVFVMLLFELRGLGYSDSKFGSLEEQLAIFLYICHTLVSASNARMKPLRNSFVKWFSPFLVALSTIHMSPYLPLGTHQPPTSGTIRNSGPYNVVVEQRRGPQGIPPC
ncbi:hypothetical protein C8R44DRAFT_722943 [Mycena epipterygia]|nr:hypothetical protein C8R44DRAFT_722943 [Mycena epipterygia]